MRNTVDTSDVKQTRKEFNLWIVYAVCLVVSILFMFFYGLNSPIHTFNSHCDYQWYLTMGRGWVAGKIPYRDLFDHKGPITYAVFAIASLFPNAQIAVWCVEVACVSLFLFFCYKIARKFLSPWLALLVVPLMMMVLSSNACRGIEGSCVEEYCLPLFAYGLLCFLDFIMDQRPTTWQRSLALGICIGILFWVKFTLLGFLVVALLIWLIINLKKRQFRTAVCSVLTMFGGLLIVTIPIIIYFVAVGALKDLFDVYFLVNIGNYRSSWNTSGKVLADIGKSFIYPFTLYLGGLFFIFFIFGLLCFIINFWKKKSGWLLFINVFLSQLLISCCCSYIWFGFTFYYLPLYTYVCFGCVYTVKLVAHPLNAVGVIIQRNLIKTIGLLIFLGVTFAAIWPFVINTPEIGRAREQYAPLVVADIIAEYNQTMGKKATVFGYRIADAGFYNAANIVPEMRFYAQSSFTEEDFPEMFASFDETIREQVCDFVVAYRDVYDKNAAFLSTYYHPYFNNDIEESTLPFEFYEPIGYLQNKIVILLRN